MAPERVRKLRALVIDDEELDRERTTLLLKGNGYEVLALDDGIDAVDLDDDGLFDVIILDIRMPIFDGKRLGELWAMSNPKILSKVIVTSTVPWVIEREKDLHVFATLKKPFTEAQLMELVALCVRSRTVSH